jgi:two-component system, chemotaxis family, chemotaxis protein CheY
MNSLSKEFISLMKRVSIVSVIDDDDLFQFIMKKLLIASKVVDLILPFPNGKEAFDYFQENKRFPESLPDIVFLDIKMPIMNGWQFLERFSKESYSKKQIQIYICTTSVNSKDEEISRQFSLLSGYFIKPITRDQIEGVLGKELS